MNAIERKVTYVIQGNENGLPNWYWRDGLACGDDERQLRELRQRFEEEGYYLMESGRVRLVKRTEEIEVLAERMQDKPGCSDERD